MKHINDSVGRRGSNQPQDVRTIQTLLNQAFWHLRAYQPLSVDGVVKMNTVDTIIRFQRDVMNLRRPDGRVDPDGRTLRVLSRVGEAPRRRASTRIVKPNWISIAEREIGVREIRGESHNPRVLEYHSTTGAHFVTDEDPWCSSFVNWVMLQAGHRGTQRAQARSWANWGRPIEQPAFGSIVVFNWDGVHGHVGFVVARSGSGLRVLGGNQNSTSVNVSTFNVDRVLAYVVPENYQVPQNAYLLDEFEGESTLATAASTR